jgi:hypothetical protein
MKMKISTPILMVMMIAGGRVWRVRILADDALEPRAAASGPGPACGVQRSRVQLHHIRCS